MSQKKKYLKIGCGCAVLLLLALVGFVAWWYRTAMEDPQGIEVEVDLPASAQVGEELELAVTIRNLRERSPFHLSDIAIDNSFHDPLSVVQVSPRPELQHDMQLVVVVLYRFDLEVPPGGERQVVFRFRAEKQGVAEGEVMISEGRRSLVHRVRLEVLP